MSSATLLGALASVALHVATHPYGSTARHVTMQQAPPKFDADAFAAAAPPSTLSRTIAEYPDPALRAPCNDVAEFDASLAALCGRALVPLCRAHATRSHPVQACAEIPLLQAGERIAASGALLALHGEAYLEG